MLTAIVPVQMAIDRLNRNCAVHTTTRCTMQRNAFVLSKGTSALSTQRSDDSTKNGTESR